MTGMLIRDGKFGFMDVAYKEDFRRALDKQKIEARKLIITRLEQVKKRKTKGFHAVCDRLEKKNRDTAILNQGYGASQKPTDSYVK